LSLLLLKCSRLKPVSQTFTLIAYDFLLNSPIENIFELYMKIDNNWWVFTL